MDTDPYFWTQDNGAGAPVHFATTYKQLDMVRLCERDATPYARGLCPEHNAFCGLRAHLPATRWRLTRRRTLSLAQLHHIIRNCRETVNQRDPRGLTALHRAAFLAQYDGYLQMYEYLLVRRLSRGREQAFHPLAFRPLTPRFPASPCAERGRRPHHPLQGLRSVPASGAPPAGGPGHQPGGEAAATRPLRLPSLVAHTHRCRRCASACWRWRRSTPTCPRCATRPQRAGAWQTQQADACLRRCRSRTRTSATGGRCMTTGPRRSASGPRSACPSMRSALRHSVLIMPCSAATSTRTRRRCAATRRRSR